MDCAEALELLSPLLDGERLLAGDPDRGGRDLDRAGEERERRRLEAHLRGCGSCREALEQLRAQDRALRQGLEARRERADLAGRRAIAQLRAPAALSPPSPRPERARRLRSFVPFAAAAAGFLAAALLFSPWGEGPPPGDPGSVAGGVAAAPPAARVTVATRPTLTVLRPGAAAWTALGAGESLAAGSRLRTGAARCEVVTADGSEVRLDADTELALLSGRELELASGRLLATVAAAPRAFAVLVPQAAARVTALGTRFDVRAEGESAVVTVVEGSTRVAGRGGSEDAVLGAGEEIQVVAGVLAAKSQVRDLVLATRWVHEILVLKGRENPELSLRIDELFARIGREKLTFLYESEIRALGDHCVLPMARYLGAGRSGEDSVKRAEAARILADVAPPWAIGELVALLEDSQPEVRVEAARALRRLTGLSMGPAPEGWTGLAGAELERARAEWRSWWAENRHRYPGA
jgi:ferric-dicitrate binding protein FerR (iron transport regulator)